MLFSNQVYRITSILSISAFKALNEFTMAFFSQLSEEPSVRMGVGKGDERDS
jgi:hypothetical protein